MLVAAHVDAAAAEDNTLGLETQTLLEAGFSSQLDFAPGAQNALPGQAEGAVQGPGDLARRAGIAGGPGHRTISGDAPARDLANGGDNTFTHGGWLGGRFGHLDSYGFFPIRLFGISTGCRKCGGAVRLSLKRAIRWSSLTAALLLLFFATGCGSSNANLRVLHASPNAPALNFLINGDTIATLDYTNASGYVSVSSGAPRIEVQTTTSTNDLVNTNADLSSSKSYTLLAENVQSSMTVALLLDDNTQPASGQFRLRVAQASPTLGTIDLYVVAPGTDPSNVSPTWPKLIFETATGYLNLAAGSYEILATPNGAKSPILLDSGPLTFNAGQVRTAVALDAQGGGAPASVIMLKDLN